MRIGRHPLRSKYGERTHVCRWRRHGLQDVGVGGALYIFGIRVAAFLAWRNVAGRTGASLVFVEVFGMYIGSHKIDGRSNDWVF